MSSRWTRPNAENWERTRSRKQVRFAILGAGAIGCLFASKLKLSGNDVTLIHRNSSAVREIRRHGVTLREIKGRTVTVHVPIRQGPVRVTDVHVLIVAVKAYDTASVARSYRGKVDKNTAILSLQNGLGNIEMLGSQLKNPIMAGSTSEGALSISAAKVVHTGAGLTTIGSRRGAHPELASHIKKVFDAAGLRTKVTKNIQGVLWTKAIMNTAINPLTALTGLSNGALAKAIDLIETGSQVIAEGITVSRSRKVRLEGDPRTLWKQILESTGGNKSSMLQDIERGRMTEIRQLNGAIVAYAKKVGVRVPINEILTRLVLGLESSNLPAKGGR